MKNEHELILTFSKDLLPGLSRLIEQSRQAAAVFVNAETTLLYWSIGVYINNNLKENNRAVYGSKILATLTQELTRIYGKGFSYSVLTCMCKVGIARQTMVCG